MGGGTQRGFKITIECVTVDDSGKSLFVQVAFCAF